MMRWLFACVAMVAIAFAAESRADLMISLSDDGTGSTDYTVEVGGVVEIPFYVLQTDPTDLLTVKGLFSAGVQVNFAVTGTNATVTSVDLAGHWGGLLDDTDADNSLGFASMIGSRPDIIDPVFPPTGENAILIGSVKFTGNVVGDVTNISTSDVASFRGDVVVDGDGAGWDSVVFATAANGTITTIPEPSSFLLMVIGAGLVGIVGLVRRHRRLS